MRSDRPYRNREETTGVENQVIIARTSPGVVSC